MLSKQEEDFLKFWAENRLQQKRSLKQFLKGLSSGIAIGVAILLILGIGWYSRANMEANVTSGPALIIISIVMIAFFMAFMYNNYQWEQKEQRFLELSARKKALEKKEAESNIDPSFNEKP
jgi:hypothetical protein